jgi:teichuronic acid biosynthesis glycosyltransferase TuaG
MTPFFSVVMPMHNHEHFVGAAIESVLNQTYDNFELVICDDGSNDNSYLVASQYKDKRIKIVRKPNGGVASALNTSLLLSKGEYLTWLSSDDLYHPTNLQTHYTSHLDGSNISITNPGTLDIDGKAHFYEKKLTVSTENRLAYFFLSHNYVNGLTVSFRRHLLALTGLFSSKFTYAQDEDYWIRLFHQEAPKYTESRVTHTFTRIGNSNFESHMAGRAFDSYYVLFEHIKNRRLNGLVPKEYLSKGINEIIVSHCLSIICHPSFRLSKIHLIDQVAIIIAKHLLELNLYTTSCRDILVNLVESSLSNLPNGSLADRQKAILYYLNHDLIHYAEFTKFSTHLRLLFDNGFIPKFHDIQSYLSSVDPNFPESNVIPEYTGTRVA